MQGKTQTHRRWAASRPGHPRSHSSPLASGRWQGPKGPRAVGLGPPSPGSPPAGENLPHRVAVPTSRGRRETTASYRGRTEPAV